MENVLESRVHMKEGLAGAPGSGLHPEANEEPLTDMHWECLAFWSVRLHTVRGPAEVPGRRLREPGRRPPQPFRRERCAGTDCGAHPPGPTEAP